MRELGLPSEKRFVGWKKDMGNTEVGDPQEASYPRSSQTGREMLNQTL